MDIQAATTQTLAEIHQQGLYKRERVLNSPQGHLVQLTTGESVINLCANNYLGLSNHPAIVHAAHQGLDRWGFGLSSVRFICGTQDIHRELERRVTQFLGTEDTILYGSCFDANGGLFETLLTSDDAIISDQLNHASIIDGIRLSKARRYRYRNRDMNDLRCQLQQARTDGARVILITTDGVFSMDGTIAPLDTMRELADEYGAHLHFDDCHATGFVGATGRGTHEACGITGRVDLTTGTFGKALGGASGGYTSGRRDLIDLLRQRSRPYLFSNSLAPPIVAGTLAALDLIERDPSPRTLLHENTLYFRERLHALGFKIATGSHPIVPILLGDAPRAVRFADQLLARGIYVVAFSYPVVPQGQARIRTQISAAHTREDLDRALDALAAVRNADLDS